MTRSKPAAALDGKSHRSKVDWDKALAEHDRWLRTVVYSRLRDGEGVDEVMQEVALAAVRQAAPLADPDKVAPWLYRLAIRQVLLYRRKRGRQRKLVDRYTERAAAGDLGAGDLGAGEPLQWLLALERRGMIRRALERLPQRDVEILLLKYTENWSYHQIAGHLGVSHSAVESRLHRARQKLRAELAAMNVVEAAS